jgi:hypothetical protein
MEIALIIAAAYFVLASIFFVVTITDKYVEVTPGVVVLFIVASLFWPVSSLLYILDRKRNK